MTTPHIDDDGASAEAPTEESPEKLPPSTWLTLLVFAAFVVGFGTCASTYLFR
ncbi:hypothetical protein [uncultured Microbacterium sp.]|uniref:hypothetical protein n=1 Tax=uncultured Microbacterium sp. TaxID=191216 RepID=UPI00262E11AD|nr:hypothetical protein [uncultured Microbacterium sp.]